MQMKVLIACVCDHAWVENGCLSIARVFDEVNSQKYPYLLHRMSIGLRLLVGKSETGEHKLNISLIDIDGKKLMNTDFNINILPPQESVPEASFSFALNGQNFTFPKPGDYAINIIIDGQIQASIPIYARQQPTNSEK